MTFIVRLTGQDRAYGPFTDSDVAYGFARYLTVEVDPATVEPYTPGVRLVDPVADLLAWREHTLATTPATDATAVDEGIDTTALAAVAHCSRDAVSAALAIIAWLDGPDANPEVPVQADRMLSHIAATANRARVLLAREAADLDLIRAIGDKP